MNPNPNPLSSTPIEAPLSSPTPAPPSSLPPSPLSDYENYERNRRIVHRRRFIHALQFLYIPMWVWLLIQIQNSARHNFGPPTRASLLAASLVLTILLRAATTSFTIWEVHRILLGENRTNYFKRQFGFTIAHQLFNVLILAQLYVFYTPRGWDTPARAQQYNQLFQWLFIIWLIFAVLDIANRYTRMKKYAAKIAPPQPTP